jgi:hypothetical protein
VATLVKTDGGRQSSGYTCENKDCTVRSFALAADVPYDVAHDVAKRSGRKNNKGWWPEKILAEAQKAGLVEFVEVPVGAQNVQRYNRLHGFITKIKYPTVTDVARRYRKGRYVISTRNHATALIDGVIHDTGLRPRAQVVQIFEVRPVQAAPAITQPQVNELWERLNRLEAR